LSEVKTGGKDAIRPNLDSLQLLGISGRVRLEHHARSKDHALHKGIVNPVHGFGIFIDLLAQAPNAMIESVAYSIKEDSEGIAKLVITTNLLAKELRGVKPIKDVVGDATIVFFHIEVSHLDDLALGIGVVESIVL
jgi:hypothetical protein